MIKSGALFFVAATFVAAPLAWGQQGPGGGRGGFGGGGGYLLNQKSVQQELKLSEEQVKKIEEQGAKQLQALGALRDLDREERGQKMRELAQAGGEAFNAILNPDQLKRFKQISLQQRGAGALADPEVAKAVDLTDEQQDKVRGIQRDLRGSFSREAGGGGDRAEAREKFEAARKAANEKLEAVLTADQQTKWKELLGEPFKGEITRPQFRGNGDGPRGNRQRRGGNANLDGLRQFFAGRPIANQGHSNQQVSEVKTADGDAKADSKKEDGDKRDDKKKDDEKHDKKKARQAKHKHHGDRHHAHHGSKKHKGRAHHASHRAANPRDRAWGQVERTLQGRHHNHFAAHRSFGPRHFGHANFGPRHFGPRHFAGPQNFAGPGHFRGPQFGHHARHRFEGRHHGFEGGHRGPDFLAQRGPAWGHDGPSHRRSFSHFSGPGHHGRHGFHGRPGNHGPDHFAHHIRHHRGNVHWGGGPGDFHGPRHANPHHANVGRGPHPHHIAGHGFGRHPGDHGPRGPQDPGFHHAGPGRHPGHDRHLAGGPGEAGPHHPHHAPPFFQAGHHGRGDARFHGASWRKSKRDEQGRDERRKGDRPQRDHERGERRPADHGHRFEHRREPGDAPAAPPAPPSDAPAKGEKA